MSEASQKAYQAIQDKLGEECKDLAPSDYFEVIEELESHVESLIDCYKEEHREDFL